MDNISEYLYNNNQVIIMKIENVIKNQRTYFEAQETKSYKFRMDNLKKLRETIKSYEVKLMEAMKKDLGKSYSESYMTEIGIVYKEISYMERKLKSLMKKQKVKTPFSDFPSKSFIIREPYGVVGVISPWNYPVNLTLVPLVGIIASGNTCIIKPSEYSVHTSEVIKEMFDNYFDSKYIYVLLGGVEETTEMLNHKFDFIFFTGSTQVGKIVMSRASEHLTPVCLELGGKSPVVIDRNVDMKKAAKRVAFGKMLNTGQTCIAPDYVLIDETVKNEFIDEYMLVMKEFYPEGVDGRNYGKIINKKHYDRIKTYLETKGEIIGGKYHDDELIIEPAIIDSPSWDDLIMKNEIFGPLLPVLAFKDFDEAISLINDRPKPLALYLFTRNKENEKKVLSSCSFGGGCVNDTISQIANDHLPFGGVGDSGVSSYHGKASFDLFSHKKSVLKKSLLVDIPLRYLPFDQKKDKVIKRFLK